MVQRKILFYSEGWGLGGIESFIMNVVKQLDPTKYKSTIFCTHDWSSAHDEKLANLGIPRYTVFKGYKPGLLKRLISSSISWWKLLRTNNYDVVHINTMNGIGFVYAFIAKLEKVPVRIVHSHNTDFGSGARGVKEIAHSLGKRFLGKYSTANLASSHAAGSYLFDKHPFTVIKNGIDTVHFRFSEEKRTSVRKQLNLSNTEILIGTVGRLAEAKNPLFQVDILRSLMARGIDAKLLLVGDGPMKGKIIEYSASLGIESKVIIPGASSDPAPYFSALDISTVPSTFEGFGITIIEAMASGLYCLYSDAIPPFEFNIPNQHMIASRSADSWSSEVVHLLPEIKQHPRENDAQLIKNCGYDIDSLSTQLSTIYNN